MEVVRSAEVDGRNVSVVDDEGTRGSLDVHETVSNDAIQTLRTQPAWKAECITDADQSDRATADEPNRRRNPRS